MSKNAANIKASSIGQEKIPASLLALLKPYAWLVGLLILLTFLSNGLNLTIPKLIASAIDDFHLGSFSINNTIFWFALVVLGVFIFTYLQNIVQVYASEKVARDLRTRLSNKISISDHSYIQNVTSEKLLTNLTSDIDAVKTFISLAIPSIISSVFLLIGASVLLIMIDWQLALAVLTVLPIIAIAFYSVMKSIRKLFKKQQEAIDWLNKIINESILGASLIRLLNSQEPETEKFLAANSEAKSIGLSILRLFASIIPVITFMTNLSSLIILALGGHFVISGAMTLGNFTAFNNYLAMLIFPIIIIGFMGTIIAQASASYQRVLEILKAPTPAPTGGLDVTLHGEVRVKDLSLSLAGKRILKDISFAVPAGSKTAIIGPTAAGKTQLLYALTGLLLPSSGDIFYDDKNIAEYDKASFYSQVALVFQDSIIFNLSLRENIAFSTQVSDKDLELALQTAELSDFVNSLPDKLDTIISERGGSLSGGQKQRVMLARALALNPKVLLLDDFTARLDASTEKKILDNVHNNYPDLTLISVTQKISAVEKYEQIILLMEGELLARGKHTELMSSSPEYVQIYNSQRSTSQYELSA